ncbi:transposase domain-containing protein [Aquabacterium sp. A7-Y]
MLPDRPGGALTGRTPWVYLKDVLNRLPSHASRRIGQLLPE